MNNLLELSISKHCVEEQIREHKYALSQMAYIEKGELEDPETFRASVRETEFNEKAPIKEKLMQDLPKWEARLAEINRRLLDIITTAFPA